MDQNFTNHRLISGLFYTILIIFLISPISCRLTHHPDEYLVKNELFNDNWEFFKDYHKEVDSLLFQRDNKLLWQLVDIPHTAQIEPLVIKGKQWQGICLYRKFFKLTENEKGKHIALKFDGAMQVAEVYLNGKLLRINYGGYLPFYIDISDAVDFENENCLLVRLDNKDNPQVPPGKPMANLDFNIYSGIYRNVWLIIKDKLHISDAIYANRTAAGGVFVSFPEVNEKQARIKVNIDVDNLHSTQKNTSIKAILIDREGKQVARYTSGMQKINAGSHSIFEMSLDLKSPKLWSPGSPYLYTLQVDLYNENKLVDAQIQKLGIRTFTISPSEGFVINGKHLKLRGTNRHQEYPYIGYALSDNANYRDAYKIKQAGFNFVRLSHYPQSESFLNACDELGLLVMDAIPGWQYFGDSLFQDRSISNVRSMIRRDRNHPSIIIWEASLNESEMSPEFMNRAHQAVHQEFPGTNVYSAGWIDDVYDIFIPARQHSKPPAYWNNYNKNKPLLIAEYGDWEYYAQNAGFNQKSFKDLSEEERNSRQLRAFGQKRLLQQALNYQESHNDNLNGNSIGDANWLMFDYNRGYAPDIEASGIMDICRLPKSAFYFYQSQIDADFQAGNSFNKPILAFSNFYNDPSFLEIKIFSNCDEIELWVNGKPIERRKPDADKNSTNLAHPPFTFLLKDFIPGTIEAQGYISGKNVISCTQRTPGSPYSIKLWIDESSRPLEKACNDVVFLYASIIDKNGTIIPDAINRVKFTSSGDVECIGNNPVEAEAGIACILLKAGNKGGLISVGASSEGLIPAKLNLSVP